MAQTQLEEDLKLTAARAIYKKADMYTPGKGIKWSQWWSDRFGEDYFQYVERMKEKKVE